MCFSPFKDTLTGYHAAFPCLQLQCHGYGKDLCVGKAIKNYLPSPDSTHDLTEEGISLLDGLSGAGPLCGKAIRESPLTLIPPVTLVKRE